MLGHRIQNDLWMIEICTAGFAMPKGTPVFLDFRKCGLTRKYRALLALRQVRLIDYEDYALLKQAWADWVLEQRGSSIYLWSSWSVMQPKIDR